jgi:hypothetical protein
VLVSGHIQQLDFSLLQQRVQAQQNKASYSKTRLQAGGALTVEEAWTIQAAKTAKETQKQLVKEARAATQAQKRLHQAGIEARKQEQLRKNRVTAFRKAGRSVPLQDLQPIIDPEAQA